ncbi:MAG: ferredoxin family protein [Candidatus Hodarchaeota archaeon]
MRCILIPPSILINHDLCILCLKCIRSCPAEILLKSQSDNTERKSIIKVTEPSLCFECRACEVVCSVSAIRIMCEVSNKAKSSSTP